MARGLVLPAGAAMVERRRMVARHQRRVRPELDGVRLQRAVGRVFESYAEYWVESFRLPRMTRSDLAVGMEAHGVDHLDDALQKGNGIIAVMPHLGGWDYGGAYLASLGYPVTVVAERVDPPELFDWFVELRAALDVTVVPLDENAGRASLAVLRRNEILGLISDRDIGRGGVEVDFFGERTTLPAGPATLALRTGAAIVPVAVYFNRDPGHLGIVEPPLDVERRGRLREDVARVTQQVAHALERLIRRHPEQWHLMQPNWPSDRTPDRTARRRRRA
jgi:KDO2-lipid IV(A) lauroyltransferase